MADSAESGIHQAPHWLSILAAHDFGTPCSKDAFCTACLEAYCPSCCPHHEHGTRKTEVKIIRGTTVLKDDILNLIDCSDIQAKLCGTEASASNTMKLEFLHGVALRPRVTSTGKCCTCDASGFCTLDCKMKGTVGAMRQPAIGALLSEDFTSVHYKDSFCVDCSQAYSATLCMHHEGHKILSIGELDGGQSIILSGNEDWAYFYNSVDRKEILDQGKIVSVFQIKSKGPSENRCECGCEVPDGRKVCSTNCFVCGRLLNCRTKRMGRPHVDL